LDANQEFGDMQRGAGLFEHVIGHVYLRPTFPGSGAGSLRVSLPEAADGAELGVQRCFKYGKNGFF